MFSPMQLKAFIEDFQSKPFTLSSSLSPQTQALITLDNFFTWHFFESIYDKLSDNLIEEITAERDTRRFLTARGTALRTSNIAYTRAPFLPANQLCLKVAESLAGIDEPVFQILMPSVKALNRKSYSFKAETENNNQLALEEFMVNSDFDKLIPVEELFNQARLNTNTVFPDYQKDGAELQFQLTLSDFLALRHIGGNASQEYMHALETYHAQRNNIQSLGFSIQHLARILKKGSVSQLGTEEEAESYLISSTIKDFYDFWFALPLDVRNQVNTFRVSDYGAPNISLEQYFLALFYGHPHCILDSKQIEQAKKDAIFNCIDSIANIFDAFLSQFPELYTLACDGQFSQIPDLALLNQKAVHALKNRSFTLDGLDISLFSKLCDHFFAVFNDNKLVVEGLTPCIYTYSNFVYLVRAGKIPAEEKLLLAKNLLLTSAERFTHSDLKEFLRLLNDHDQTEVLPFISAKLFLTYKIADFAYVLKDKSYQSLADQYILFLLGSSQLHSNFVKALQTVPLDYRTGFITKLQPNLKNHVNMDNITDVLDELPSEGQILILHEFFNELLAHLDTPTKFSLFSESLTKQTQPVLARKVLATLESISSLEAFNQRAASWSGCPAIITALIESYTDSLMLWLTDEDKLLSLMKSLAPQQANFIAIEYSNRFQTLENVCLALTCIRPCDPMPFINALALKEFIGNIQALEKLLSVSFSAYHRVLILKKFNPDTLNCSTEQYQALFPQKALDVPKIIEALKTYCISQSAGTSSSFFSFRLFSFFTESNNVQDARELIVKLEKNPRMNDSEIIELIRLQMHKIETQPDNSTFRDNPLYKTLQEILGEDDSKEELIPEACSRWSMDLR